MWKQPRSVRTRVTHPYKVKHGKRGNNKQDRVELYLTEVNNSEANGEIVPTLSSWQGCGVLLHSATDSLSFQTASVHYYANVWLSMSMSGRGQSLLPFIVF